MAKEIDLSDGIIYITDQQNMVNIMNANINLNSPIISHIQACELDWYSSSVSISQNPNFQGCPNSWTSRQSRYRPRGRLRLLRARIPITTSNATTSDR